MKHDNSEEYKLAVINRDIHEDHPRNNQARNTNLPRIHEDYITQMSEEIEGIDEETVPAVQ